MTSGTRCRADEISEGQSALAAMNIRTHRQLTGSIQAKLGEPAPMPARRRDEGWKARRDRGADK